MYFLTWMVDHVLSKKLRLDCNTVKIQLFVNVGGGPCFVFLVSFAGLEFAERG